MLQGVSYPFYYPYYDVAEKWPPLEIFGGFARESL